MSASPEEQPYGSNSRIAEFVIEKVWDLWGEPRSNWGRHEHPEYEKLAAELCASLELEFGAEAATRATAELLCYKDRPQEVASWSGYATWKERERRQRVGFGCWVWQASHPSDPAQGLFAAEFDWESAHPAPQGVRENYLASDVLASWAGRVPEMLNFQSKPVRTGADPRALTLIEGILERELLPWARSRRTSLYARYLIILKSASRLDLGLCRRIVSAEPGVATDNDSRALEPELSEIVFEFAAELTEENSHRFCYFSRGSGARWVIRACENVERLGLSTLASKKADAYDRNHAIRKIADIESFAESDDLEAFQAELSRFSPATRRLVAGCSGVAREYLLATPEASLPPAFEEFKKLFLSCNRAIHIHFDNSPDPTDGVLPVAELSRLAEGLGQDGRAQMLEDFAQIGDAASNALMLLKGLFGIDRKRIEAGLSRMSQAAVKAYGLIPLPAQEPERSRELAERHARIQSYLEETANLKAGRRVNSRAAAQVALANLAQVAGFPSVLAMELELMLPEDGEVETLPSISCDPYTARIILTTGRPELEVMKQGKPQKSVPPALKKLDDFKELKLRQTELAARFEQFSKLFEESMFGVRPIPPGEFSKLLRLPVARWQLERLLLECGGCVGIIDASGSALVGLGGSHSIDGDVRIVHPILLEADTLAAWQEKIKTLGIEPPFPQLLREVHPLLPDEAELTDCIRFRGIRIDDDKAVPQLTRSGWSVGQVDYPFFYKGYPRQGLRASLIPGDAIRSLQDGDGFLIGTLCFSPIQSYYFDHYSPLPLGKVDPVVFSESIRALTGAISNSQM